MSLKETGWADREENKDIFDQSGQDMKRNGDPYSLFDDEDDDVEDAITLELEEDIDGENDEEYESNAEDMIVEFEAKSDDDDDFEDGEDMTIEAGNILFDDSDEDDEDI